MFQGSRDGRTRTAIGSPAGRVARACLLALSVAAPSAAALSVAALPRAAGAATAGPPRNLECHDIRRLSDNYLLDLRVRMIFLRGRRSYARLENNGRGWHLIDERPYVAAEPTRILLTDTPYALSYIERLTGDYYHIDYTGTGMSVWGRCILVEGTQRAF